MSKNIELLLLLNLILVSFEMGVNSNVLGMSQIRLGGYNKNSKDGNFCPNPLESYSSKDFKFKTLHRQFFKPCIFEHRLNEAVEVRAFHTDTESFKLDFSKQKQCKDFFTFESVVRQHKEILQQPYFICKSRKLQTTYDVYEETYFDIWEDQMGNIKFLSSSNYDEGGKNYKSLQLLMVVYKGVYCSHIQIQQYSITDFCNSSSIEELSRNSYLCGQYNCSQESELMQSFGFLSDKSTDFPAHRRSFITKVSILISNITSLFLFVLVAIVLKTFVLRYWNKPYVIRELPEFERETRLRTDSSRARSMNSHSHSHSHSHRQRSSSPNNAASGVSGGGLNDPNNNSNPQNNNNIGLGNYTVMMEAPPPSYDSICPPSYSEATQAVKI